jgi:hypothetical protein
MSRRDRSRRVCARGWIAAAGCVLALGAPAAADPGGPSSIIGGNTAKAGQYPSVAAIRIGNDLCTGTLVSPVWVLTAGHCVDHVDPGQTEVHIDDPSGVVDFAKVIARLDDLDYRGKLSIEYFNLPEHGWPLDDPVGWATDLAAHLRPLLGKA